MILENHSGKPIELFSKLHINQQTKTTMEAQEIVTTEVKNEETVAAAAVNPQERPEIPAELNQQQALQVLVDAARIAQSKGIFTLDDAELVNKAIRAFVPKGPVPSNG
jgi:hypothetical protein